MCSPDRDALADWLAGWLDPAAATRTAAHVLTCPACRAEVHHLAQLATAVRTVAAHRAETIVVPAYRRPPPAARRAVLPFPGIRSARPPAPAAARLRVAAGLMAAVAVAIGAVVWRAGSPLQGGGHDDSRRADNHFEIPAPAAPTVVVRRATAVDRNAPAALAARTTARGAAPVVAMTRRDPDAGPSVAVPIVVAVPSDVGPTVIAANPTASSERDGERPDAPPSPPPSSATAAGVPTGAPPAPIEPTSPAPPAPPTPPTLPATPATIATPVPIATPTAVVPTIAGIVIGADGGPLAGARVVVEPFDGGGAIVAVTAADGRYSVDVAPGRWLVHAGADGYALMWHGGAPAPLAAPAIDVTDDLPGPTVDFALEPVPGLFIRGRVVDAAGNGVPGALVVAARPGDRAVDVGAAAAAVYADSGGNYSLPITPGGWLVAATADWRRGAMAWWGGDGSILEADRVSVDVDIRADDIDVLVRE